MLDIVTRENYPKTTMIDEHDERQKNIYTWFNYHIDDSNKNHKFKTNQEKENLIILNYINEINMSFFCFIC